MLKIIKIIVFLFFVVLHHMAFGQNFIEDFDQINNKYKNGSYHLKLSYNYYNEPNSAKPEQIIKGEVRKKENNYFVKFADSETIIGNDVFLQINHDLKAIILDSNKEVYYKSLVIPMDSILKLYKKVEFEKLDSNTGKWTIFTNSTSMAYTELLFDLNNFSIKKITIHFYDLRKNAKEGSLRNKLVVNYDLSLFTPIFTNESFSHSKYLIKTNGKYALKDKYKNYNLVDNLNK